MGHFRFILCLCFSLLVFSQEAPGATYRVGPEQEYRHPGHVPWAELNPGDVVEILWRPEPYRYKWVMFRPGTQKQPIIVRGIRNDKGEPPVFDANRAATPTGLEFWSEARGVIKIGGANGSGDEPPAYLVIENLDIQGARPERFFLGKEGLTEYSKAASAIYVESGNHITIRNCRMHDCGNGIFVAPDAEDILVEGCDIFDNGNEGSIHEHNAYSESMGMIYQFNRFGPLRTGCRGNNLKDRSSGLIARYNRIEKGNRQLDLVDSQEGLEIRNDPRYHLAQVYGNLLIEHEGPDNNQIVHFGGDSGDELANRRKLLFYNNTVISTRETKTVLFRLSTSMQSVEAWNNVLYTNGPGSTFAILDEDGQVDMRRCWIKPGWKQSFGELQGNIIATDLLESDDPGFLNAPSNDFSPAPGSPLLNAGATAPQRTLPVEFEPPRWNQPARKRRVDDRIDLGCFEAN